MRGTILVLVVLFAASPLMAGKVEMCVDDACTAKIKREKLDCSIHKNKKKSLTFSFKATLAFALTVGPEVTFGRSTEINWNRMSQELIRRYEELCDMHNKGLLSVAEFNRKYDKLEEYFDKAKDLKDEMQEVEDTVAGHADKAFKELDAENSRISGLEVQEKLNKLNVEVDVLSKQVRQRDEAAASPDDQTKPGKQDGSENDSGAQAK